MSQVIERPVAFAVVAVVLAIATVTDLRERRVPLWLTAGGIVLALVWAVVGGTFGAGAGAVGGEVGMILRESGLGLLAGLLILSPFVVIGMLRGHEAIGLGDILLLGVIGAWLGWVFVLWCTWWMSIAGGLLGIVALVRKQRTFPYVPALLLGFIATALIPIAR
jgi:prepilin peptidase CpaA